MQRPLHGVIQPGGHHQKQEQCQHIDAPVYQQQGAGQCHGSNAQLQHHSGSGDKDGVAQFSGNGLLFHIPNFTGQAEEIAAFCIAGFQVAHGFDILLNAVGTAHFHRHGPGLHPVLHLAAAQQYGNGHRNHPQGSQRHSPVKQEQPQGNEHRGNKRTEQTGDEMRAGFFQHLAVGHNGAGQVGQIPLAKEGQGELPQLLGQGQPPNAAFFIGSEVGAVILNPGCQENQYEAHDTADYIKSGSSFDGSFHQVADEKIQQTRRQHKGYILQRTGQNAFYQTLCALRGGGSCPLNFFNHGYPSFATFHWTDD